MAPPGHPFTPEARSRGYQIALSLSIREIEDGAELGDSYDAAVVLYQLEKAIEPLALLEQLHAALHPGGVLLLATPSLNSWPARFFGDQWTEWRPENRYYFDNVTIQSILWKAGFTAVSVEQERRQYTLRHVNDRAMAFPRTSLTRLVTTLYKLTPTSFHGTRVRIPSSGMVAISVRGEPRVRPLCSIIVAAYNERSTFSMLMDALLAKQLEGADKEVIVVESNSKDGTREVALQYESHPEVKLVLQERPRGKGHAVRAGFDQANGDFILIQDADSGI